MGIVNVIESKRQHGAGSNKDSGRRADRSFTVLFDDASTSDGVLARLAPGIPRIGSPHPEDVFMWAYDIESTATNNLLFEVTVKYRSAQASGDSGNPIVDPPVIEWDFEEAEEPVDQTILGGTILNANFEAYDPPLTKLVGTRKLIIERNVESFDPFAAQDYEYVVNSDNFAGFPAGCGLLKPVRARQVTDNPNFLFWRIHAEILFRVDPQGNYFRSWEKRVLHRGFKVRDAGGQPPYWKADANGNLTPTPVLLKVDGVEETNPANALWIYYPLYRTINFASLGLL